MPPPITAMRRLCSPLPPLPPSPPKAGRRSISPIFMASLRRVLALDQGVRGMVVDGLEVLRLHRPRGDAGVGAQAQRDVAHQVLDELGIVVGALGDPLLVGALEQAEDLARGLLFGHAYQFAQAEVAAQGGAE